MTKDQEFLPPVVYSEKKSPDSGIGPVESPKKENSNKDDDQDKYENSFWEEKVKNAKPEEVTAAIKALNEKLRLIRERISNISSREEKGELLRELSDIREVIAKASRIISFFLEFKPAEEKIEWYALSAKILGLKDTGELIHEEINDFPIPEPTPPGPPDPPEPPTPPGPPDPPEPPDGDDEDGEGENEAIEKNKKFFNDLKKRLWAAKSYQITKETDDLTPLLERLYGYVEKLDELGLDEAEYKEILLEFYKTKFALTKSSIIVSIEALELNDDPHTAMDEFQNYVMQRLLKSLDEIINLVDDSEKGRFQEDFKRFEAIYVDIIRYYMATKSIKNPALGLVGGSQDADSYPMKVPESAPVYLNSYKNADFGRFIKGEHEPIRHPDLNVENVEISRSLGTRMVEVFGHEGAIQKEVEMEVKTIPEAMRVLDLFFQGITPKDMDPNLASYYRKRRRTLYGLNKGEIAKLVNDYRAALAEENYQKDLRIAQANGSTVPNREDDLYKAEITEKEAWRAWNSSVFLMRHFTLAPSSFNKPAPGYYMFSPDYALGESQGSGKLSPLVYFYFIGLRNADLISADNPEGLRFHVFDGLEEESQSHSPAHGGLVERSITKAANLVQPKDLRNKIRRALENKHLDPNEYWFLFDAPTNPLTPVGKRVSFDDDGSVNNVRYHYRAFTSPLSNMVLRDENKFPVRSTDGYLLKFSDLVDRHSMSEYNPNGETLYELMDFENCDGEEQLEWWFGQVKNASTFYKDILFAPSEEFASKATANLLNALGKDSKYVSALLEPYALELDTRYGDVSQKRVIRMLVISIAHLKGIHSILSGKDLHHVIQEISSYNLLHCTDEDKEAIKVALTAGFTIFSSSTQVVTTLQDQIASALKFPK